jgi:hypothetical protein
MRRIIEKKPAPIYAKIPDMEEEVKLDFADWGQTNKRIPKLM